MLRPRVRFAVRGTLLVACAALPLSWLVRAVGRAREEARAAQCVCNLACLEVALRNYESTYGFLPPAAIADADGSPLLSWRVAILPFIEQDGLYKQIKLDEPWDSEHNKKLIAQMPEIYLARHAPAAK